jgi:hypothetical protein
MKDLIAKLEAATEGSRELDLEILTRVMGYRDIHGDGTMFDRGNDGYWSLHGDEKNPPLPSPTTSLDAALTLVPEGWVAHLSFYSDHADCELVKPTGRFLISGDTEVWANNAKTGPLALCIAALRARSAT